MSLILNSDFGHSSAKDVFPPYFQSAFLELCFALGFHRLWLIFCLAFFSRQDCELLEIISSEVQCLLAALVQGSVLVPRRP